MWWLQVLSLVPIGAFCTSPELGNMDGTLHAPYTGWLWGSTYCSRRVPTVTIKSSLGPIIHLFLGSCPCFTLCFYTISTLSKIVGGEATLSLSQWAFILHNNNGPKWLVIKILQFTNFFHIRHPHPIWHCQYGSPSSRMCLGSLKVNETKRSMSYRGPFLCSPKHP